MARTKQTARAGSYKGLARPAPRANAGSHHQQRGCRTSFVRKLKLVLRQVNPSCQIFKVALHHIDEKISQLATNLARVARELCTLTRKRTVTAREIQTATRLLLPGDLCRHAISEGTRAVTKFVMGASGGKHRRRTSPQARAGLQFKPSLARNFIKDFGASRFRVGKSAGVYLAGVLEYMSAEILELSANACKSRRKKRISALHVNIALAQDKELHSWDQGLSNGVGASASGVNALSSSRGGGRNNKKAAPHRGAGGRSLGRQSTERFFREVGEDYKSNLRYRRAFFDALRCFIREQCSKLIVNASSLSSNRSGGGPNGKLPVVTGANLCQAHAMSGEAWRFSMEVVASPTLNPQAAGAPSGFSAPAATAAAAAIGTANGRGKSGANNITPPRRKILRDNLQSFSVWGLFKDVSVWGDSSAAEQLRVYIKQYVVQIIRGATAVTEHRRKKTVSMQDFVFATDALRLPQF